MGGSQLVATSREGRALFHFYRNLEEIVVFLVTVNKRPVAVVESDFAERPVDAFLEIVQGIVREVFVVMRRPDGGSPCGGRGATALPSVAARCAPSRWPRQARPLPRRDHNRIWFHAGFETHFTTAQWPPLSGPMRRMNF